MNDQKDTSTPNALMLLSNHCAYCPSVLDSLTKMIKAGDIGSLKIINLEKNPESMQEYNVRSVPWVRIGKHELTGAQTLETLKQRAEWAIKDLEEVDNTTAGFDFLLSDGQVNKVIEAIKEKPEKIQSVMELLGDPGTVLSSRIGMGVVFEEFIGTELIKALGVLCGNRLFIRGQSFGKGDLIGNVKIKHINAKNASISLESK